MLDDDNYLTADKILEDIAANLEDRPQLGAISHPAASESVFY
jgi:hypothetical protein